MRYALRSKSSSYDLKSVFFVRYELRLRKRLRIEQTIPHGINTWQHLTKETNPWFATRIKKRQVKEPEKYMEHIRQSITRVNTDMTTMMMMIT